MSADGKYTKKCQSFFENKYGFKKTYLTHSCTQALEMASLLMDLKPGDEVIVPAYTHVSTASAFALRGCKLVFADSRSDFPGVKESELESLINHKTRAIVVVHYGGISCDMDVVTEITKKHRLFLVEDAAAAINSYFRNSNQKLKALGTYGHFATFSFHETKNISCGEGGMLAVNDAEFFKRANEVWNRGTNKNAFLAGEKNKYEWVSLGSAFAPSEINAAWLWAQLGQLEIIQAKRKKIWDWYEKNLHKLFTHFHLEPMKIPKQAIQNYHLYYALAKNKQERDQVISHLREKGILSVFHYQALHKSPYYLSHSKQKPLLLNADKFSDRLLRFPFYTDLDTEKLKGLIGD